MIKLIKGDCLVEIKNIGDNSVDAIITDPPYELGFMGKCWDSTGIANNVELWRECLRILKPGGYLLSFSATRTYHRMACAIEDAGFEVRDMIEWVYGSGFPKSLNIGKAVDKLQGNERDVLGEHPNPAGNKAGGNSLNMSAVGMPETAILTKGTSEWEGWGTALKPSHESILVAQKSFQSSSDFDILFVSLLNKLKKELCQYQSFAKIVTQNLKLNHQEQKEEVNIAQWLAKKHINTQDDLFEVMDMLQLVSMENTNWSIVLLWLNILQDLYTAKNTYTTLTELNMITELKILNSSEWESIFQNIIQAKNIKNDGLNVNVYNVELILKGVQLKLNDILTRFAQENVMLKESKINFAPNHEPICMARKPLAEKTVAENVLKWGTGGINIDESRVDFENEQDKKDACSERPNAKNHKYDRNVSFGFEDNKRLEVRGNPQGRFPANLIHDGSEEVMACFPETKGEKRTEVKAGKIKNEFFKGLNRIESPAHADAGGNASRFFKSIIYTSKPSKAERNKGCEPVFNLFEQREGLKEKFTKTMNDWIGMREHNENEQTAYNRNFHPTVKPVKLMEYLIKMVTQKGGVVFEPFMGSGTTGVASKNTNRSFIGIEMETDYFEIAKHRINNTEIKNCLFD